jgi:hypothetical protein
LTIHLLFYKRVDGFSKRRYGNNKRVDGLSKRRYGNNKRVDGLSKRRYGNNKRGGMEIIKE